MAQHNEKKFMDEIKNITNTDNNEEHTNTKVISLLKNIGEKSIGCKWMHDIEANHYSSLNHYLLFAEIILISILTTITSGSIVIILLQIGISQSDYLMACINSILLILTLMYCIIKGIREAGDYSVLVRNHKYSATKYHAISLNIQKQLALSAKDRMHEKEFLIYIQEAFTTIQYEEPNIRRRTKNKYLQELKKMDQNNEFNDIEILLTNNSDIQNYNSIKNKESVDENDKYHYEITRYFSNF